MKKAIFLIIFFLPVMSYAGELPDAAYKKFAEGVIKSTLNISKGMPSDFEDFCKNPNITQITNWEYIYRSTLLDRCKNNPGGTFLDKFTEATFKLISHKVGRNLGCYTTKLEDFEKEYAGSMVLVNEEEYTNRLKTISKEDMEKILQEEAQKLGQKILFICNQK